MSLPVPLPERRSRTGTRDLGLWGSDIDQPGTNGSSDTVVNPVENASNALSAGLNVGDAQRVRYTD